MSKPFDSEQFLASVILVSRSFSTEKISLESYGWVGLVGLSACFVIAEVDCVSRVGFRCQMLLLVETQLTQEKVGLDFGQVVDGYQLWVQ